MKFKLTQDQIGNRIAKLRKAKGISQDVLAKQIEMSRPSLAQVELGKRNLDVLELQKIAMVLGFSMDDFMSDGFEDETEFNFNKGLEVPKPEERISVPKLKVEKFKNILLYILERCAGKPNVGETVLYKLLYFSDFNYYELYEEQLTGAKYRKLPFGPVPQKIDSILKGMMEANQLQRIQGEYRGYPQTRYLPLEKADLRALSASEAEVIDKVIDQMSDWTATAISEYSHKDIPWLATEEGKDINYELAFYRELPYSVRVYDDENE